MGPTAECIYQAPCETGPPAWAG